jgi:putative FmdB family regulatory protein
MPAYEYECTDCGETFEVRMSNDDSDLHPDERCPNCDSPRVEQLVAAPTRGRTATQSWTEAWRYRT